MNELKTLKTAQCEPINIGDVMGSISVLKNNSRYNLKIIASKNPFFNNEIVIIYHKNKNCIEFRKAITLDNKRIKPTLNNRGWYIFNIALDEIEYGHYEDYEIIDESLFLYYP